jgi:16S rRNA (guanine527-N7)-methyltransferase
MPAIAPEKLVQLLRPYYPGLPGAVADQLLIYLELLVKWNGHTNLTSIRDPEEIVQRHFGESLFLAANLPPCKTLLDLGSGAGFPGLPVQLVRPDVDVTLAESRGKKAAFLREAVRTLALPTRVWADRVENLPPSQRFDIVALRAVDHPKLALELAHSRISERGVVMHLAATPTPVGTSIPMPDGSNTWLNLIH